jgi:hypothetical protein
MGHARRPVSVGDVACAMKGDLPVHSKPDPKRFAAILAATTLGGPSNV